MKPTKYKISQIVKTPHGAGKIIGSHPHRLCAEDEPSVWMHGVTFDPPKKHIPTGTLPFLESELDLHNADVRRDADL